MTGVSFVNRNDVGGVIIEGGEPFLLLFLRPIVLRRRDVVIRFIGAFLEWTWRVHRRERGGAQVLRGLFHLRSNLRWDARPNDWLKTYLRILSRSLATSGMRFCGVGCSLWICLKTSIGDLFGSIFLPLRRTLLVRLLIAPGRSRGFLRRKINEFCLRQEAPEFFFAQREIHGGFRKFLPLQPRGIIVERICAFAVGLVKGDAKLFVLEVADSGNEIFFRKSAEPFAI